MRKRSAWLIGSFVIAVILTSCGTSAPPTTTTAPPTEMSVPKTTAPSTVPQTTAPAGKPQYGGVLRVSLGNSPQGFDEVINVFYFNSPTLRLTNEELWGGDWAKGPAGTNEIDWTGNGDVWKYKAGYIGESWDFSQLAQGTMIWKIRKGIHWALNPNSEASKLVNGRELTADDVVSTLKMLTTNTKAYLYRACPELRNAEIKALDKYTVSIKVDKAAVPSALLRLNDNASIVPPEVVSKYGDMSDWKNSVGTGPFMLTDYVSNSSVTFVKNPNYWGTDPVGPGKGSKLPYLDGAKFLIIPDASTVQAAFRTGSIDVVPGQSLESGQILTKGNSKLQYKKYFNLMPMPISMHVDKAPYNDVRVRRALMLSTDFNSISKDLYQGEARINTWPVDYSPDYKDAFLSLDDPDCPASVKELYSYSPEKAKSLLKEAGYPNGLKSTIIIPSGTEDYYSVIKSMWAKTGIDLTLDVREYGVWYSIQAGRQYVDMIQGSIPPLATIYQCLPFWGSSNNYSFVNDPKVDELRAKMIDSVTLGDQTQAFKMYREFMKYALDQAWSIPLVESPSYVLWWPWVNNYHGEQNVGYWNDKSWIQWLWIDSGVKSSMGH